MTHSQRSRLEVKRSALIDPNPAGARNFQTRPQVFGFGR